MTGNKPAPSHARFSVAVILSALFIGLPGSHFLHRYLRPYYRFGYSEVKRENITAYYDKISNVKYSNGVQESLVNDINKKYGFWQGPMFLAITCIAVLIEYVFIRIFLGFSIFNDFKI